MLALLNDFSSAEKAKRDVATASFDSAAVMNDSS